MDVSFVRATLRTSAFSRHRHGTYSISVTERGVQEFDYRGAVHRSLPGQVVILHPDEAHDGRPATPEGFTYRGLHVEPSLVAGVVHELTGRSSFLPFARTAIVSDPALARLLWRTFDVSESLEEVDLVHDIGVCLLRHSGEVVQATRRRGLSDAAFARARDYLDTHFRRSIDAAELEAVCSESRYNVGEAFRRREGTSPHRYLLMRRLSFVRDRIADGSSLAAIALDAGFSDQAHMTRHFKATFGLTPATHARLTRASAQARPCAGTPG